MWTNVNLSCVTEFGFQGVEHVSILCVINNTENFWNVMKGNKRTSAREGYLLYVSLV